MQHIMVIIIVAIAAFYIGRKYYRSYKAAATTTSCSCGCDTCSSAVTCEEVQEVPDDVEELRGS